MEVLDVLTLDDGAPSSCHVPEMPDRDIIVVWEVGLHLAGEEPIHLPLVLELGCELGRSHCDNLVDGWLEYVLIGLWILHY